MNENWKYKSPKDIAKENWIDFIVIVLVYMMVIGLAGIVIYSWIYEGNLGVNNCLK